MYMDIISNRNAQETKCKHDMMKSMYTLIL
jgi:hypothetical protein